MFVKTDSYDSFSESLDGGTLLRLSMRSATLPAARAPIPNHLLFVFFFSSLLTFCLCSGSLSLCRICLALCIYSCSPFHCDEVFFGGGGRGGKGGGSYKWLGIQFGLL